MKNTNENTKAGEQTQHTPGPWHVEPDSTCSGAWLSIRPEGDEDGDYEICQTATFATSRKSKIYIEDSSSSVWEDKPEADEIRANARLIAAAPELLEAAKLSVCERLGSIEEAQKWAAMYRDGSQGKPDKGLLALIDAITKAAGLKEAK